MIKGTSIFFKSHLCHSFSQQRHSPGTFTYAYIKGQFQPQALKKNLKGQDCYIVMSLRSTSRLTLGCRIVIFRTFPISFLLPTTSLTKQLYFHIIIEHEKEISSQEPQLGVTLLVFSIFSDPNACVFDIPGHISILTSTLIYSHCWLPRSLTFPF